MRLNDGRVLLSPVDLATFLGCRHPGALDDRASVEGETLKRAADDEGPGLVKRRGDEDERMHRT